MPPPQARASAAALVAYLNASPTPFHAVHNAALRLQEAGFVKIRETDDWDLKGGGKYYYTRNQSALIAFTLPEGYKPGTGLSIVATHVDSPNLRLRPVSKLSAGGFLQVAVETYGGGIWHTWLDRDLSVAGRIVTTTTGATAFTPKLIKIERPLIRIPSLAIHLDRTVNEQFKFNKETEFVPILGVLSEEINKMPEPKNAQGDDDPRIKPAPSERHHPALLTALADELSIAPEEIHDFELALYDTNPATIGGLQNEFIFSPRLDNLMSSFCAVEALCESLDLPTKTDNINCIALFDHEEVGSVSAVGANSSLLPSFINRLSPTPSSHAQSVARSLLLSCDVSHAFHPSFASKYHQEMRPKVNAGMVLKTNANQRYATEAVGSWVVRRLAARRGGIIQDFEVRNDISCGTTVGPLLAQIGLRVVDVGAPILSMHSIRETAGAEDVKHCTNLFLGLFEGFREELGELTVD